MTPLPFEYILSCMHPPILRLANSHRPSFPPSLPPSLLPHHRYYPSQVQLLSGWVHHIFYLGVLSWALSSHFTLGFCLFSYPSLLPSLPPSFPTTGTILPKYSF